MLQILSVWNSLEPRRRVVVILASIAVFAVVVLLSRVASSPGMSLLYAGLESSAAGDVIATLEQQGAIYEVRGGAIFVESNKRDSLRMTLASEGLPANSTAGYELLDSLSGFGTTAQMFDAAYWRAKEGELARTITANTNIRGARVHIASPSSQPFRRKIKTTASVTVTTAAGSLSAVHAKALKFLVASAVSGLQPDDVAIIDAQGGLISGAEDGLAGAQGSQNRGAELKKNVQRLLEARVGYGNAVVEISLETVMDRESIVEKTFDPESRVVISTDTQELSTASEDKGGASVSVASNLPEGDGSIDKNSSSNNSETRERVNYEVSEVQREILKLPGAIKRMTVAVLVDGSIQQDDTGAQVFIPRSAEELVELKDLVAAAVGFNQERGDVITLKSMEFKPIVEQGSLPPTSIMQSLNLNIMSIIQISVLAIVALVLGLFVVRPILKSKTIPVMNELSAPDGDANDPTAIAPYNDGRAPLPALTGEIDNGGLGLPEMATVSDFDLPEISMAPMDGFPMADGMGGGISADPVTRLKQIIEDREAETVEVLRGWMENKERAV